MKREYKSNQINACCCQLLLGEDMCSVEVLNDRIKEKKCSVHESDNNYVGHLDWWSTLGSGYGY